MNRHAVVLMMLPVLATDVTFVQYDNTSNESLSMYSFRYWSCCNPNPKICACAAELAQRTVNASKAVFAYRNGHGQCGEYLQQLSDGSIHSELCGCVFHDLKTRKKVQLAMKCKFKIVTFDMSLKSVFRFQLAVHSRLLVLWQDTLVQQTCNMFISQLEKLS